MVLVLAPLALVACGGDVDNGRSGGNGGSSSGEGSTGIFSSSSCTDICERQQAECMTGPQTDCAKSCTDAEAAADKAGCGGAFDAFVDCVGDVEDLCTGTSSACGAEASEFINCTQSFCQKQPNDPACSGSGGTG